MDLTPAHFSPAPAASTPGTVDGLQPATPGALPILVPWGQIVGNILNQTDLVAALAAKADTAALNAHTGDLNNPHQTTKTQVGLGNVDNTSDMNKPVSTAQAAAIAGVSIPSGQISDASVLGKQLLTNATAAQDRTALGSGANGDALFTGATAAANRGTLGSGTTGDALFLTSTASAARQILGLDGQIAYRNLFFNGGMECNIIAQAAATTNGLYFVDGIATFNNVARLTTQQESTALFPGYNFCLLSTVTSSGAPGAGDVHIHQIPLEGTFVRKLGWGASGAASVVVQFLVRSSITGTFPLAVRNAATNRSYVTTFTVNAANTNELKTFVIPGDTSGTWPTNAALSMTFAVGMAVGSTFQTSTLNAWQAGNFFGATGQTQLTSTNGATFRITALDITPGTVALPPEVLPLDVVIPRARRYFFSTYVYGSAPGSFPDFVNAARGIANDVNNLFMFSQLAVDMIPAVPTVGLWNSNTGTQNSVRNSATGANVTINAATANSKALYAVGSASLFTAGQFYDFHFTLNNRI